MLAATPTPATTGPSNDVDMAVRDPIDTSQASNDAYTRASFRFLGDEVGDLSDKEREAKKQKFEALVVEK